MAHKVDLDALGHSVTWAVLALTAWWLDGWGAGFALLFGPAVPVTAVTWYYLVRRGEIERTRTARWLALAVSALAYAAWRAV